MSEWSLEVLLSSLHEDIQQRLSAVRKTMGHPGAKGDSSERVWLDLFKRYLPKRYQAEKAFVVDSEGVFSDQIDVVIFDQQYSPFIFKYESEIVIPAESVYAVFEAKQSLDAKQINYAKDKIKSVRKLKKTSLPIPHAGGIFEAKPPIPILGGILTLESDWKPKFGPPLKRLLADSNQENQIDFGCVSIHGFFHYDTNKKIYNYYEGNKPATGFLFKLISEMQFSGTVPMIDIQAYARWLN